MISRRTIMQRYGQYLGICNRHAWDELDPFLAEQVLVNGREKTRDQYVEDLRSLETSFPDYQWRLHRAVLEDDWLAVHLRDTGTRMGAFLTGPGDGSHVETDEFAMYRFSGDRICEVEVTADNARLASMKNREN